MIHGHDIFRQIEPALRRGFEVHPHRDKQGRGFAFVCRKPGRETVIVCGRSLAAAGRELRAKLGDGTLADAKARLEKAKRRLAELQSRTTPKQRLRAAERELQQAKMLRDPKRLNRAKLNYLKALSL